jgi:hypothetical protein
MSLRSVLFFLCLFLGFGAQNALAQTVANEVNLTFGEIVVGGTGTVTIPSSSDTRTSTGSVALLPSSFIQRGRFEITHTPGALVNITAPPSALMSGANAPTLTPTIEGGSIQTIPPGGVLTVYVGGTITYTTFGSLGSVSVVVSIIVDPI